MKLVSGLLTAVTVAAFGFACGAFALTYIAPEPVPFDAPERAASVESQTNPTRDLPDVWPAVFGVIPPEPEPEPEPAPVEVELPPEENTTYYLTGLIAGDAGESWAMISENDRGVVVRVGDELIGGEIVTAINAEGVLIDYQGELQLIPVQRSDLQGLVWTEEPANNDTSEPTKLVAEITIPVEQLSRDYITSVLQEAGRLETSAGDTGMEIVWMQQGLLYDQMGLRTGDTIVRVNGNSVATKDLLVDTPDADLSTGSLNLEILRDGTRRMLKVNLDQG